MATVRPDSANFCEFSVLLSMMILSSLNPSDQPCLNQWRSTTPTVSCRCIDAYSYPPGVNRQASMIHHFTRLKLGVRKAKTLNSLVRGTSHFLLTGPVEFGTSTTIGQRHLKQSDLWNTVYAMAVEASSLVSSHPSQQITPRSQSL